MRDPRLTLMRWDSLAASEREDLARSIGHAHPRFRFPEIRHHEMGGQAHDVAIFACDGSEFALVPGSEAVLGYDRDRPWVPDEWELAEIDAEYAASKAEKYDYQKWCEANLENLGKHRADPNRYPEPLPLQDLLIGRLTPLRRVTIAPFLMEVHARSTSTRILGEDDPDVDPTVRQKLTPGLGYLSFYGGERSMTYHLNRAGRLIVKEERWLCHAKVSAELEAQGFRLPTSDEWEYACGAGSRSLFRWGDHVPDHAYEPSSALWTEGEGSLGDGPMIGLELSRASQFEGEGPGCPSDAPNAFGLCYEQRSRFHQEFVAEADVLRHGDGGTAFCGGGGLFTALWLGQATAFVWRVPEERRGRGQPAVDVRRAYSLVVV